MSDADDTILNTKQLDSLLKALKGKMPIARVGVLGNKNARVSKSAGPSNAEIGAKHEFGDDGLPRRSFLRVPISDKMQKFLDNSNAFDKEVLKKVLTAGTIAEWVKKIGVVAEAIVAEAFSSGGFGKWKPSNMDAKKNHQTLVETGQLRDSITSEVKD